ncbi:unnamed protein product [Closterium sp. Yama58-4]|nr:unnamed protein product [Closterium sp. Yama58-4]
MVKKRKAKNQGGAGDMDIGDAAVTSATEAAKDAATAGFPAASAAEEGAAASGQEAGGPIASGNAMDTSETMGFTVIKASADAARSLPALPAMRKKGAPERRAKTRRKQKLLDKALAIREKTETKAQKHAAKKARHAARMAPSVVVVGSHVWVEDPEEAWVDAVVTAVEKKKVTVSYKGKEAVIRLKHCHPRDEDAPSCGVDDMTKLSYLHEPGVLHNLFLRYSIDEIYTYTGSILIAINPFCALPHLYDEQMMEQYKGTRLGELSPHVFAIAEAAYSDWGEWSRQDRDHQAHHTSTPYPVPSPPHSSPPPAAPIQGDGGLWCEPVHPREWGERGGQDGDHEAHHAVVLAYMGGRASSDGRTIESQVLESNPLLEAFGNAKTVRNNNSSRFGKFVEIQFDRAGRISGAAVRTYLLERSRVVQISDPERNYHAFYQVCCGASEEVHCVALRCVALLHCLVFHN